VRVCLGITLAAMRVRFNSYRGGNFRHFYPVSCPVVTGGSFHRVKPAMKWN